MIATEVAHHQYWRHDRNQPNNINAAAIISIICEWKYAASEVEVTVAHTKIHMFFQSIWFFDFSCFPRQDALLIRCSIRKDTNFRQTKQIHAKYASASADRKSARQKSARQSFAIVDQLYPMDNVVPPVMIVVCISLLFFVSPECTLNDSIVFSQWVFAFHLNAINLHKFLCKCIAVWLRQIVSNDTICAFYTKYLHSFSSVFDCDSMTLETPETIENARRTNWRCKIYRILSWNVTYALLGDVWRHG